MQNYLLIEIWNKIKENKIKENSDDKYLVNKQIPTIWIDNKSKFCLLFRDLSSLSGVMIKNTYFT
jgi:hypothetical protein